MLRNLFLLKYTDGMTGMLKFNWSLLQLTNQQSVCPSLYTSILLSLLGVTKSSRVSFNSRAQTNKALIVFLS